MPPDREHDLDNELRDLGPRVEYPPTPDLAGSVKSRLDSEGGTSAPARSFPSPWWLAAAALVLISLLPVLSPTIRDTASGVFSAGAGGVAGGGAGSGQGGGAASSASSSDPAANGGSGAGDEPTTYTQGAQAGSAAGTDSAASGGAATGYPARGESRGAPESGLQAVTTPNDKPVPDVVGAPVLEACSKLRARDYAGYVMGEAKNDRIEPGHVISQKPRDGRKGFQGQPVELLVSKPYPAEKLGHDNRCYDLTEYGPGGRPNVPSTGSERPR